MATLIPNPIDPETGYPIPTETASNEQWIENIFDLQNPLYQLILLQALAEYVSNMCTKPPKDLGFGDIIDQTEWLRCCSDLQEYVQRKYRVRKMPR